MHGHPFMISLSLSLYIYIYISLSLSLSVCLFLFSTGARFSPILLNVRPDCFLKFAYNSALKSPSVPKHSKPIDVSKFCFCQVHSRTRYIDPCVSVILTLLLNPTGLCSTGRAPQCVSIVCIETP